MRDFFPARFPGEGQGSDFAGSIVELGTGVDHLRVGEAVIGMSDKRSAHAEYVTIAANRVVPMPKGLDPRVAASLYVAATTAQATVDTVAPQPGETVAVSAAAGGVGILASQLARRTGADVIGIAGPSSAQALRDLGDASDTGAEGEHCCSTCGDGRHGAENDDSGAVHAAVPAAVRPRGSDCPCWSIRCAMASEIPRNSKRPVPRRVAWT